jgi:hypothetical protein
LCCSITCNITAGVVISIGDHKTRKKDVLEKMYRQELTKTAMKKVVKKRGKGLSPSGTTEDGLWDVVDETAEEVERMQKEKEKEREGEREGEAVSEATDDEYGTPLSAANEGTSYMAIQGSSRQSIPTITTTTATNNGPTYMSTTTTTHIS